MDKKFILKYLSKSHLQTNEGLEELCEVVGIETMKIIMEHCEGLVLRIPVIGLQKSLLKDVIKNNPEMPYRELRKRLGIPEARLRKYIIEIKKELASAKENKAA